jgi:hypothetical protein
MTTPIKPRRTYAAGAVPTTSDLETDELAVNWADGRIFTKNAAGDVIVVALGGGGGGSANIVEAATAAGFPATGASQTLYINRDGSRVYRWDSSGVYIELGN